MEKPKYEGNELACLAENYFSTHRVRIRHSEGNFKVQYMEFNGICEPLCSMYDIHIYLCLFAGRLYNHKKIHMKPQFSCCYCSKEFTIIGNLKIHEKRHMNSELVEKFECEICSKSFILKHDLRYHMRKHNGERPYSCTLCPSRFADISNLHKHIKIHTGDKPFVCHCGKSYNQQSSLNTHKKTHLIATLFESFSCAYCPKKFALEEDLTLHIRSHGVNSMFKCNFCDKEYELLNHMKSHRRIHLNLQLKRKRFVWPEKMDPDVYSSNSGDVHD